MEAAPRLPMISFDLLSSQESVQFGKKLKHYIANFYNEDPEAYISEISKLDSLRASAAHPSPDVGGLQLLKKYYCQLHFLKSRFPMEPDQPCFIEFEWKDCQNGASSGGINFELMAILHNIGVLHTMLGAQDSRSNPEGMKLACSHFQCAVWAFQTLKEKYSDSVAYVTSVEVPHFYKQVCLAQGQECILEKSMLDNRKSTIISKVAVQVWEYYRQALTSLKGINEDVVGRSRYKEWVKYLQFKIAYQRCISLLFQGQQAEELQKMGERVAFYQGACTYLEEARKFLSSKQQTELADALGFTADVVEGKRKAAKNENEYIYHEEVPDIANLQEAKGASLVKGIEFSVNDPEVSGPDIFARLVPMEAHEAASIYSEKKAELLRNIGQRVAAKDQASVEFMSSMQLDMLTKMHQATGIPQELIDRAASLSAKTSAIQDLVDSMASLSNIFHDVEANLNEISELLKEDEENEKNYQEIMGKRPPSIIITDLAREASKYREAHTKANESNETLSKAMMTHLENLKILQKPIRELQQRLPSVELPDANIDQNALRELEMLTAKVDEMKIQRAMLWAQLRDAIHNDDITNALVTKQPNQQPDDVFKTQLEKHSQLIEVLDQNLAAQDNIKKAFVDCYAKAVNTRRYIQDIIQKRNSTIQALIASHDSYDDLLAKAMKGIEFYTKLEMNVSKLLQRIKSASKVQQEEREQMLAKSVPKQDDTDITPVTASASAPKLKDYLEARKKAGSLSSGYSTLNYSGSQNVSDTKNWPPGIRPAPVGSEITMEPGSKITNESAAAAAYYQQQLHQHYGQTALPKVAAYGTQHGGIGQNDAAMTHLTNRMSALLGKQDVPSLPVSSHYNPQYSYSSYVPQNYTPTSYTYASKHYSDIQGVQSPSGGQDAGKQASTITTNSCRTISSFMPKEPHSQDTLSHMQYTDSRLKSAGQNGGYPGQDYSHGYSSETANAYQPAAVIEQASIQPVVNEKSQYPQGQYAQYPSSGQYQQPQTATSQPPFQYPQSQEQQQQYPQSHPSQQQYPQSQTPQQQQYPPMQTPQQQYSHSQTSQQHYPQSQTPQQQYPPSQPQKSQRNSQQQQYSESQTPQRQYSQNPSQPQPYPQNQTPQQPLQSQSSTQYAQGQAYSQQTGYSAVYAQQHANQTVPTTQVVSSYGSNSAGVYGLSTSVSQDHGLNNQATNAKQPFVGHGSSTELQNAGNQIYRTQNPTSASGPYSQYSGQQGMDYSSQQHGSAAQQAYFPQGYAPNYSNPVSASSQNIYDMAQYQKQYYTQQHLSSVAPKISTYNNYSTYSSPVGDPYKVQFGSVGGNMSTGILESSTASSADKPSAVTTSQTVAYYPYDSGYGYSEPNYASTMSSTSYGHPTSSSQVVTNSTPPVNMSSAKESNVDLLTGLDFSTASNIPTLTPQPNLVPEKIKEPEKKTIVSENKPAYPSPKTQEVSVESTKKETIRVLPSKPLNNIEVKALFNQELEKYEKYVETLTSKTLSGPTTLDMKWKEIQDSQELDNQKRIISVARCYPMKNRFPDILPYDYSRVELKSTGDDYINASFVKQISPFGPQFIVTQAPMSSTFGDFWAMVREQQVELIVCLLNDNEIGDDIYWPQEKAKNLTILNQNLVLSLQSIVVKSHWTERLISLTIPEKKESWIVMHLQFTSWPGSLFPTSPEPFVSSVLEVISLFQQQKSISRHVLIHCSSGIGRSGLMCVLTNAILEVTNQSNFIPDLALLTSKLGNFRKNILRDREHLKFAYEAMLCYMKQLIAQDNIKKKLFELVPVKEDVKPAIPDVQENIIDPLSTLDPFWASKKN